MQLQYLSVWDAECLNLACKASLGKIMGMYTHMYTDYYMNAVTLMYIHM